MPFQGNDGHSECRRDVQDHRAAPHVRGDRPEGRPWLSMSLTSVHRASADSWIGAPLHLSRTVREHTSTRGLGRIKRLPCTFSMSTGASSVR